MKILYNPPVPQGAPIGKGYNNFVCKGIVIDSLLPGELKQYDDDQAAEILNVFEFIREVQPAEAKSLMEKPREKELKCDKCDFSTDTKIALISHQKKHEKEAAVLADMPDIPVAKGKVLEVAPNGNPINGTPAAPTSGSADIKNGVDKDGVEWYGEGRTEQRGSMNATQPFNKGRFGGQPLSD